VDRLFGVNEIERSCCRAPHFGAAIARVDSTNLGTIARGTHLELLGASGAFPGWLAGHAQGLNLHMYARAEDHLHGGRSGEESV